jgi:hypothetical protein
LFVDDNRDALVTVKLALPTAWWSLRCVKRQANDGRGKTFFGAVIGWTLELGRTEGQTLAHVQKEAHAPK